MATAGAIDFVGSFIELHKDDSVGAANRMTIGSIKSEIGEFIPLYGTKAAFAKAIAERMSQMQQAMIGQELSIPQEELDFGTIVSITGSTAAASSGAGGGSASSGGAAAPNAMAGIYVENVPGPRMGLNSGEALPEMSLAIVPYVPPTEIPPAARANPLQYNTATLTEEQRTNIILTAVIYSLLTPAMVVAKGGWAAISAIVARLGEKTLPEDGTLLAAMRSGTIRSAEQLKYEHGLLQQISKDIVKQTKIANPQLVTYAADAFSAGQEALLAAYNMFSALIFVKDLYPQIDERTLAPKLQMKRAELDSAECNLLKAYVMFVKSIVDKYEARRTFMNEWLSLPEVIRKKLATIPDTRSFITKLFSKVGITSEPEMPNYTAGGASQTAVYNSYGQQQIGAVTSLITANEMRMINALVVSILSSESKCIPANLKAEIIACLRMKEADVPDIMTVDRFNALYKVLIRERTTSSGDSGGAAAASYGSGPNFTRLFDPASRKEAAREEARAAAISTAAANGILGGPLGRMTGVSAASLSEMAGRVAGLPFVAPGAAYRGVKEGASKAAGKVSSTAGKIGSGFMRGFSPAANAIRTGAGAAGSAAAALGSGVAAAASGAAEGAMAGYGFARGGIDVLPPKISLEDREKSPYVSYKETMRGLRAKNTAAGGAGPLSGSSAGSGGGASGRNGGLGGSAAGSGGGTNTARIAGEKRKREEETNAEVMEEIPLGQRPLPAKRQGLAANAATAAAAAASNMTNGGSNQGGGYRRTRRAAKRHSRRIVHHKKKQTRSRKRVTRRR